MKRLLIIPNVNSVEESLSVARKYGLGFEFNDFSDPDVLDDEKKIKELTDVYNTYELPSYRTMHGAFYDVIPFSKDKKIRDISALRIEQSIKTAKSLGASAVVFHTNYNPFLNTDTYVDMWIEENTEFWSKILEKYSDINIYLENMFESSPDVLERLSEKLCKYANYGVCLDYGHASLSKVSAPEWARRLGRFVKHVHINDNDLINDLHLSWGEGKIDRDIFYECYKEYMPDATVLIETSATEDQIRSLEKMVQEGFADKCDEGMF